MQRSGLVATTAGMQKRALREAVFRKKAMDLDLGLQRNTANAAGGSCGIGKAIARALAREAVDTALVSSKIRDLKATAAQIARESGCQVVPLACDVAERDEVGQTVRLAVQTLGGLHILVNSGSHLGGSPTAVGHIDTIVDDDLLHDFDVKYLGALRLARAAISHMTAAGQAELHRHTRDQTSPNIMI